MRSARDVLTADPRRVLASPSLLPFVQWWDRERNVVADAWREPSVDTVFAMRTSSPVAELLESFDLEVLDRDLYRAHNPAHVEGRYQLFGGQVAGQALRAATLTVDSERSPHSFHGYFLRPGRSDLATIMRVDRDRDGRSVSARRVTAIQEGQVIFTMSASFQSAADGPEFSVGLPPGVPAPDDIEPLELLSHPGLFDVRPLSSPHPRHRVPEAYWARVPMRLPDDPLVHACFVTYLSDLGVGEGPLRDVNDSGNRPSVDHAMWFHRPARMDEWVRFAMQPVSAEGGRLLYSGSVHTAGGALVATVMQQCLVR
jgi:acyl-CoA thioesterase-2